MLLTYVDESYTAERYYIAALMVPERQAASITAGLDKVVQDTCWEHEGAISYNAELHGYDLVAGKRDWEALAPMVRVRIGVYNKALQVIADHDVHVIIRCVDIKGLDARHPSGHDHPHSVVLTHLLERVDRLAENMDERTIMIADEVDGQDGYRRDLWQYQRSATWGYKSRKITRVLDTIHFAPSHTSRLVQAADLIAYLARRRATHVETDARAKQANEALWARIEPRIVENTGWYPEHRPKYAPLMPFTPS